MSVLLHLHTGCNTSLKNQAGDLIVPMDFSKEPISVHEIGLISDVQVINLDCDKVIFGDVSKIVKYNNRIYLMDNRHNNAILIYDTVGNFVHSISKYGQGPEEYLQLSDIFINPDDETLNIISRIDKKMLKYDLDGNRLIKINKLPKAFTRVAKTENGYIGYMGNYGENSDAYNVWVMSDSLKLLDSHFKIDPSWESRSFSDGTVFSSYKNQVYYIDPMMDYNIYRMMDSVLSVPYSFDMGSTTWPDDAKKSDQYDRLSIERRSELINRFYYFQETPHHLIAQVLYKGQYLLCVYRKETSESCLTGLNAYTGKYFFSFGTIIGMDESAIYTLVDASSMKRMAAGNDGYNDYESRYPEQVKRLREKFPDIKEDGNPFLIVYQIR
jgi:hypothetical protein